MYVCSCKFLAVIIIDCHYYKQQHKLNVNSNEDLPWYPQALQFNHMKRSKHFVLGNGVTEDAQKLHLFLMLIGVSTYR